MMLVVTDQPIPLIADADNVVRVANTRVTLDTVIAAFREGATPETIAQQYPSLALADVYAVIGYYLIIARKFMPIFSNGTRQRLVSAKGTNLASIRTVSASAYLPAARQGNRL